MVPTPGRFAKLMGALGVAQRLARGVLRPEGPGLGGARLVADGTVRPRRRRGAGWRPAEMAARGPRRPKPANPPRRRRPPSGPTTAPPGCAASATCCATCRRSAELVLDARAAGPLHRRGAGAARRHAQRPHPRLGQPALHRSAERRRNVPPARRRCARGSPQAGVDGTRPVVTSCGSGVTACILTLGLRLAGLPEGAVYDGSWTEWGGRADTPVETG